MDPCSRSLKPQTTVSTLYNVTLHMIDSWTAVCVFERWELITRSMRTGEVELARKRAIPPIPPSLTLNYGTSRHPVPNPSGAEVIVSDR